MKTQKLIHTARVKQTLEQTTESDKYGANGKRVKAKKVMESYGSGACTQGLNTTYMYLADTGEVGHELEVREGMVWQWGEGEAYFRVPTQALLGEMSCWDEISSKRGKHELKPLNACYIGW